MDQNEFVEALRQAVKEDAAGRWSLVVAKEPDGGSTHRALRRYTNEGQSHLDRECPLEFVARHRTGREFDAQHLAAARVMGMARAIAIKVAEAADDVDGTALGGTLVATVGADASG